MFILIVLNLIFILSVKGQPQHTHDYTVQGEGRGGNKGNEMLI